MYKKISLLIILTLVFQMSFIAQVNASETWQTKAESKTYRSNTVGIDCDGKFYVLGGFGCNGVDYSPLAIVEEYNPSINTWTTKSPMSIPRYDLAVTSYNGKLYAIGGHDGKGTWYNIVEEYDVKTDKWRTLKPMPTAREDLEVDVVEGKIYAIGGMGKGNNYLTTNEEYDIATDTWITKAPMPTGRNAHDVAVVNGLIYVMGGDQKEGFSSLNEVYNPETDKWSRKADMPTPRRHLGTVSFDGYIYAIGGYNSKGDLSLVEKYDSLNDTWSVAPSINSSGRNRFAIALVGDCIYVSSGWNGWLMNTLMALKIQKDFTREGGRRDLYQWLKLYKIYSLNHARYSMNIPMMEL